MCQQREPYSRRCGRLYQDTHASDSKHLFLPYLSSEGEDRGRNVTTFFIRKAIICAFLDLRTWNDTTKAQAIKTGRSSHDTISNSESNDGSSIYEGNDDIPKSSIRGSFDNRLSSWSVQDPYRVEGVLPKTTEIVHNIDEMRSIIGHNTDSERTATSENKIQFRSVDDGDEKLLSEDAARNHARELVSNQDIIISETPMLARSWTPDEIIDAAMAQEIRCIFHGRPRKRLKRDR